MKILVVSDKESKSLWDYYEPGKLDPYDLIISCGDLAPQYLSFLATFTKAPVLYVRGNHDDCYEQTPPDGCTDIDGKFEINCAPADVLVISSIRNQRDKQPPASLGLPYFREER